MNEFLNDLNEAQRAAVEWTDGPIMVIAGAGSGKTRVLTYKVSHLVSMGVEPFSILALTFTNKAAAEMKDRILKLGHNMDARNVWMGTFHSIFARILRMEAEKLGFPPNFTIYDTDDSKSVLRHIIKEMELDSKIYNTSYVLHRISLAKNNFISSNDYGENPELTTYDKTSGKPYISEIFKTYQKRLRQASAMDFDDLLFNTNVLLRDFPEALYKYQQKFRYILVDEYQDTNYSQYLIIKRLAANNENLCVVGDDAQSIYGFRGASIQNILNFKSDYPDFKLFKLEQNYRSTQIIVNAANSVISNNKDQIFKKVWTDNDAGAPIKILKATTDTEEGLLVAHSIFENKMNNQLDNSAFVILYRTNAQSRSFEEALRKLNIPYRIYGGLSFYKRKEIRDTIAYFRLVVNPNDQEALLRVINYPARGIGQTTLEKIQVYAGEHELSMWELMADIRNHNIGINHGIITKITDFITRIRSFQVQLKTMNAFEMASHIVNSIGILKELKSDETPEGISRIENIEELLNAIQEFTETPRNIQDYGEIPEEGPRTLDEFLLEVSLLTDMDTDQDEDIKDKVLLMTIHAAKGLEFPFVYIVGLEETLFPSFMSLNSRADLEEERRLFYVALTRAERQVFLSYAASRFKWGNLTSSKPSRFVEEISPEFMERPVAPKSIGQTPRKLTRLESSARPPVSDGPQPDFEESDVNDIKSGMEVEHQKFGKGKILNIEGAGPNRKATVFFPEIGQKQLLLKFAKLRII